MPGFASMVDMAVTPPEVKEKLADDMACAPVSPGGRQTVATYPYGLCLSLDDETLAKLGLDGELPDVGEMVHFMAMAKVTSASSSERTNSAGGTEACQRVELQITQMSVASDDMARIEEDRRMDRRNRFYGGAKRAAGGDAA